MKGKREPQPCDMFHTPMTDSFKLRRGRAALYCNICGWRREAHRLGLEDFGSESRTELRKAIRRTTDAPLPHGLTPRLVVTLYPGAVIGLREIRRRREYRLSLATLYERAVIDDAKGQGRAKRMRRRMGRA